MDSGAIKRGTPPLPFTTQMCCFELKQIRYLLPLERSKLMLYVQITKVFILVQGIANNKPNWKEFQNHNLCQSNKPSFSLHPETRQFRMLDNRCCGTRVEAHNQADNHLKVVFS